MGRQEFGAYDKVVKTAAEGFRFDDAIPMPPHQVADKPLAPIMIDNLCYMLVNASPREAISVPFDYELGPGGVLKQKQIDDNERRAHLREEDLRWVKFVFEDFSDV